MAKHSKTARRIALEVAEASRKETGTRRGYNPNALIGTVRKLERLRQQRRQLRRRLRLLDEQIRHEKRMLKAIAGASMGDEL
jgi:hypothetical protein